MTFQFANINGARLHYDVQGKGDALVLIHAGIAHVEMWDEQMAAFSRHRRVIRYDLRGWGQSEDPGGPYTQHDDLRALLDHLGVVRAAVLGISIGGRIAVDFTLAYPERVTALIAVAPALGGYELVYDEAAQDKDRAIDAAYEQGEKALAAELATRFWIDGPRRSPDQVAAGPRERAAEMIRTVFDLPDTDGEEQELEPPAVERLGEIETPTLLVIGEEDVQAMFPVVEMLEAQVAGARKVVIPDAGHLPNLEQPELFSRAVLEFLGE